MQISEQSYLSINPLQNLQNKASKLLPSLPTPLEAPRDDAPEITTTRFKLQRVGKKHKTPCTAPDGLPSGFFLSLHRSLNSRMIFFISSSTAALEGAHTSTRFCLILALEFSSSCPLLWVRERPHAQTNKRAMSPESVYPSLHSHVCLESRQAVPYLKASTASTDVTVTLARLSSRPLRLTSLSTYFTECLMRPKCSREDPVDGCLANGSGDHPLALRVSSTETAFPALLFLRTSLCYPPLRSQAPALIEFPTVTGTLTGREAHAVPQPQHRPGASTSVSRRYRRPTMVLDLPVPGGPWIRQILATAGECFTMAYAVSMAFFWSSLKSFKKAVCTEDRSGNDRARPQGRPEPKATPCRTERSSVCRRGQH